MFSNRDVRLAAATSRSKGFVSPALSCLCPLLPAPSPPACSLGRLAQRALESSAGDRGLKGGLIEHFTHFTSGADPWLQLANYGFPLSAKVTLPLSLSVCVSVSPLPTCSRSPSPFLLHLQVLRGLHRYLLLETQAESAKICQDREQN